MTEPIKRGRGRPRLSQDAKAARKRQREQILSGAVPIDAGSTASILTEAHPDEPPHHRAMALRSEGQRKLLYVTGSLHAIAREIEARSPQSVADWRSGKRVPAIEARARMQHAFGIPIEDWARAPITVNTPPLGADGTPIAPPPTDAQPAPPPAAPAVMRDPNAPIPSALESCLTLLAQIQADRSAPGILPSERVKLADAEARILKLRADLEQRAEYSEDRYVRDHPAWQRVRKEIARVLGAFPEAARAVADALERLEM